MSDDDDDDEGGDDLEGNDVNTDLRVCAFVMCTVVLMVVFYS